MLGRTTVIPGAAACPLSPAVAIVPWGGGGLPGRVLSGTGNNCRPHAQHIRQVGRHFGKRLPLVRTGVNAAPAGAEVNTGRLRGVHGGGVPQDAVVLAGWQSVAEPLPGAAGVIGTMDCQLAIGRDTLAVG